MAIALLDLISGEVGLNAFAPQKHKALSDLVTLNADGTVALHVSNNGIKNAVESAETAAGRIATLSPSGSIDASFKKQAENLVLKGQHELGSLTVVQQEVAEEAAKAYARAKDAVNKLPDLSQRADALKNLESSYDKVKKVLAGTESFVTENAGKLTAAKSTISSGVVTAASHAAPGAANAAEKVAKTEYATVLEKIKDGKAIPKAEYDNLGWLGKQRAKADINFRYNNEAAAAGEAKLLKESGKVIKFVRGASVAAGGLLAAETFLNDVGQFTGFKEIKDEQGNKIAPDAGLGIKIVGKGLAAAALIGAGTHAGAGAKLEKFIR